MSKQKKNKVEKAPVEETPVDEAPVEETPAVDQRISDLNRTLLEKQISEFLTGKAIAVNQSVDHVQAYNEAIETFTANGIGNNPLDETPANDEAGFALVKAWFSRLGFAEVMASESIYKNQLAIAKASFKKASNTTAKLRGYLNSLTDLQVSALEPENIQMLFKASLFLKSANSTGQTGTKSKRKSGFRFEIINTEKRPSYTGDRADFLNMLDHIAGDETKHETAAADYLSRRKLRGEVGRSTYEQQFSKFKSLMNETGYGSISDIDV